MKIFLIFSRKSMGETNIPPLGIMSLAATLRAHGHTDIRLFDMAYDSETTVIDACRTEKPDLIGLSTDSISFDRGAACIAGIRKVYGGGRIILGGVHPTIAPEEALRTTGALLAAIGEGEETVLAIVDALEGAKDIASVKGIAYRDGDTVRKTGPRPFIENLDTVPFPARDLLPMERYLRARADVPMLMPVITVFASRGCYGNCIYCQPVARTLFGKTMRHRSVENVIDEIEMLQRTYSFRTLFFTDDELLYNGREWVEELAETMIRKRLRLRWTCQARVDQVQDEGLVALLRRAGCYAIGFGVESGSQSILNYMRKGYTTPMIDNAFRLCRKQGIITTCNLMVGTPGESSASVAESRAMIARIHPNLIRVSITTPTPGSDLHTKLIKENRILISRLSDFDRWAANPIRLDDFSKEEIRVAIRSFLTLFYRDFFRTVVNPLRLIKNWYFVKVLVLRYLFLLKSPARFWQDLLFYLTYFKHRKGHPAHEAGSD
jgi:anaerobic magnesium-protoporphyrin IX monomethyl ester cyclase